MARPTCTCTAWPACCCKTRTSRRCSLFVGNMLVWVCFFGLISSLQGSSSARPITPRCCRCCGRATFGASAFLVRLTLALTNASTVPEGSNLSGSVLFPALAVRNSLWSLNLRGNEHLTELGQLGLLTHLRELDLTACAISELPPALMSLSSLERLILWLNPLGALPASFAQLAGLKHLHLAACGLSEFPAVLLRLKQLEYLNLMSNQLRHIGPIASLVKLRELWLDSCGLEEFPRGLTQLEALEIVHLSGNQIRRLPGEMGGLCSLKILVMDQWSRSTSSDAAEALLDRIAVAEQESGLEPRRGGFPDNTDPSLACGLLAEGNPAGVCKFAPASIAGHQQEPYRATANVAGLGG
eukprot:TRINITY_DN8754_c1_g1_i1.p1 TRINITY_DN8754_c1_g1~~TRINITY_DN8754_c1_g1_i1.p1  ORF type:complete len:355 (-),score=44.11 TRINITY_DN8754_c1_g1_i1:78-1142(-)